MLQEDEDRITIELFRDYESSIYYDRICKMFAPEAGSELDSADAKYNYLCRLFAFGESVQDFAFRDLMMNAL